MVDLDLDNDDVDFAPYPDTKKGDKYDIAPKDEKGDDDGEYVDDDHSAHSFDDDDRLEEDHEKKFEPLRVKVGLSWENVSIKT